MSDSKIKIKDLATELKMDAKELLQELQSMGFNVKSAQGSIPMEEVSGVRDRVAENRQRKADRKDDQPTVIVRRRRVKDEAPAEEQPVAETKAEAAPEKAPEPAAPVETPAARVISVPEPEKAPEVKPEPVKAEPKAEKTPEPVAPVETPAARVVAAPEAEKAPEAKPVSLLAKAELFIADTQKNPVGKMLPYMTFRTPDDSVINTGGFRRRTTLFTVWASYDSLSRRQMQVVRKLREKHSRYYLNIVSVALDSDESAWREVLRSDTLTGWPQCILKEGWNATQVENLGIQMLPATFVINGNGRIVAKNLYDDALIEAVDKSVEEVGEDKMLDQMAPSRKRRR